MMEASKKIDTYLGTWLCYICSLFVSKKKTPLVIENVHTILAIKLIALGDLMLVMPQLKLIKDTYPDKKLILLTTTRVKAVVERQPFIDQIIYLDVKPLSIIKTITYLKTLKIDLSIDFEHYYRITALICFFANIKQRIGFLIPGQGRDRLFTFSVPYDRIHHELLVFNTLLSPLHIAKKPELVGLPYTREEQNKVDKALQEASIDSFILIQPGTSGIAIGRRWHNDRWVTLISKLNQAYPQIKIMVVGGPIEQEIVKNWQKETSVFLDWTTKFNLAEFYYLVTKAKVFIGLDTGTTHIAASAQAKIVALYGLNNPDKWGPYGQENVAVISHADPAEYSYNYLGKISKLTESKGMQSIQMDDVFKRVVNFLR
jgi:ADP-heptose:LPS heptosyltransferase